MWMSGSVGIYLGALRREILRIPVEYNTNYVL
jgi:hypothetical protein